MIRLYEVRVWVMAVFVLLFFSSCLEMKEEKKDTELPSSWVEAVRQSQLMTRDSGKEVTSDFLENCVKERTSSFVEFSCDDLLWSYYLKEFSGKKGKYLYLVEDGASVENRAFFSFFNNQLNQEKDTLPSQLTHAKIAQWLNTRFQVKNYTAESLEKIAHSHYRTEFSKTEDLIIIKSGYLPYREQGYQPIGKAKWDGEKFILLDE